MTKAAEKTSPLGAPVEASTTASEGDTATASASGTPMRTDVVLIGPPTADGGGVHVLRARDERIEAGELRNLEEGKPIRGEIVTLTPRKDNPRVCDVTEIYAPKTLSAPPTKGPAQVATKKYRENWEEVFATRRPSDADLN